MPIKRSNVKELDFREDDDEPTYCQHCQKVGVLVRLAPRLYGKNEIPYDDENWLQCYRCGRLVEIYNVKYESEKLRSLVEPSDDPFDFGRSNISGVPSRNLRDYQKRLNQNYDDIKDENLRQELKKGSILVSYSDTQN